MKKQLIIIGIVVLLVTVGISGCVEEEVVKVVTAEEIKEGFLQAVENVTSYKFSLNGTYEITTINETTNTTEYSTTMTGEVDNLNREIKQYSNINYGSSNEEHSIFYLVDNISYTGNEINGNITWTNHFLGSEMWIVYSWLEHFATALENGAEQYNDTELGRLSDETAENVDCYTLQFTGFKNETITVPSGFNYIEFDAKYWIAKNTNLLIKSNVKLTSDAGGSYYSGGTTRMITTEEADIIFYDYNVPLNIEVPPEAKD